MCPIAARARHFPDGFPVEGLRELCADVDAREVVQEGAVLKPFPGNHRLRVLLDVVPHAHFQRKLPIVVAEAKLELHHALALVEQFQPDAISKK